MRDPIFSGHATTYSLLQYLGINGYRVSIVHDSNLPGIPEEGKEYVVITDQSIRHNMFKIAYHIADDRKITVCNSHKLRKGKFQIVRSFDFTTIEAIHDDLRDSIRALWNLPIEAEA